MIKKLAIQICNFQAFKNAFNKRNIGECILFASLERSIVGGSILFKIEFFEWVQIILFALSVKFDNQNMFNSCMVETVII